MRGRMMDSSLSLSAPPSVLYRTEILYSLLDRKIPGQCCTGIWPEIPTPTVLDFVSEMRLGFLNAVAGTVRRHENDSVGNRVGNQFILESAYEITAAYMVGLLVSTAFGNWSSDSCAQEIDIHDRL